MTCCELIGSAPLPANSQQICRYIGYLSDRLKYVSIVNYVSAISLLHKLYGYNCSFLDNYMVRFTLSGLRRVLGDPEPNRPTLHVQDLLAMYRFVQVTDRSERAFWASIVLGFRSLLRKSNLVVSDSSDHVLLLLTRGRHCKGLSGSHPSLLVRSSIGARQVSCVLPSLKFFLCFS